MCFAICPHCPRFPSLCKLKRWHSGDHSCYEGHVFSDEESEVVEAVPPGAGPLMQQPGATATVTDQESVLSEAISRLASLMNEGAQVEEQQDFATYAQEPKECILEFGETDGSSPSKVASQFDGALPDEVSSHARDPVASYSLQQDVCTDAEWARRLSKRKAVVEGHKRRRDYKAYLAAVPLGARTEGMPTTPDTTTRISKRAWEIEIQRWRQGVRVWELLNREDENSDDESPCTPTGAHPCGDAQQWDFWQ